MAPRLSMNYRYHEPRYGGWVGLREPGQQQYTKFGEIFVPGGQRRSTLRPARPEYADLPGQTVNIYDQGGRQGNAVIKTVRQLDWDRVVNHPGAIDRIAEQEVANPDYIRRLIQQEAQPNNWVQMVYEPLEQKAQPEVLRSSKNPERFKLIGVPNEDANRIYIYSGGNISPFQPDAPVIQTPQAANAGTQVIDVPAKRVIETRTQPQVAPQQPQAEAAAQGVKVIDLNQPIQPGEFGKVRSMQLDTGDIYPQNSQELLDILQSRVKILKPSAIKSYVNFPARVSDSAVLQAIDRLNPLLEPQPRYPADVVAYRPGTQGMQPGVKIYPKTYDKTGEVLRSNGSAVAKIKPFYATEYNSASEELADGIGYPGMYVNFVGKSSKNAPSIPMTGADWQEAYSNPRNYAFGKERPPVALDSDNKPIPTKVYDLGGEWAASDLNPKSEGYLNREMIGMRSMLSTIEAQQQAALSGASRYSNVIGDVMLAGGRPVSASAQLSQEVYGQIDPDTVQAPVNYQVAKRLVDASGNPTWVENAIPSMTQDMRTFKAWPVERWVDSPNSEYQQVGQSTYLRQDSPDALASTKREFVTGDLPTIEDIKIGSYGKNKGETDWRDMQQFYGMAPTDTLSSVPSRMTAFQRIIPRRDDQLIPRSEMRDTYPDISVWGDVPPFQHQVRVQPMANPAGYSLGAEGQLQSVNDYGRVRDVVNVGPQSLFERLAAKGLARPVPTVEVTDSLFHPDSFQWQGNRELAGTWADYNRPDHAPIVSNQPIDPFILRGQFNTVTSYPADPAMERRYESLINEGRGAQPTAYVPSAVLGSPEAIEQKVSRYQLGLPSLMKDTEVGLKGYKSPWEPENYVERDPWTGEGVAFVKTTKRGGADGEAIDEGDLNDPKAFFESLKNYEYSTPMWDEQNAMDNLTAARNRAAAKYIASAKYGQVSERELRQQRAIVDEYDRRIQIGQQNITAAYNKFGEIPTQAQVDVSLMPDDADPTASSRMMQVPSLEHRDMLRDLNQSYDRQVTAIPADPVADLKYRGYVIGPQSEASNLSYESNRFPLTPESQARYAAEVKQGLRKKMPTGYKYDVSGPNEFMFRNYSEAGSGRIGAPVFEPSGQVWNQSPVNFYLGDDGEPALMRQPRRQMTEADMTNTAGDRLRGVQLLDINNFERPREVTVVPENERGRLMNLSAQSAQQQQAEAQAQAAAVRQAAAQAAAQRVQFTPDDPERAARMRADRRQMRVASGRSIPIQVAGIPVMGYAQTKEW